MKMEKDEALGLLILGYAAGKELPKRKQLEYPFELHKRLEQIPEKALRAFILFYNRIKV